jgi:hypothetical protein
MIATDHRELTFKELLDDPMVQLVMRRDSVERDKLVELMSVIRRNRLKAAEKIAA